VLESEQKTFGEWTIQIRVPFYQRRQAAVRKKCSKRFHDMSNTLKKEPNGELIVEFSDDGFIELAHEIFSVGFG
jgi:hypothetical protein